MLFLSWAVGSAAFLLQSVGMKTVLTTQVATQGEITAPSETESPHRASDSPDSPQTWGRGQEEEWDVAFGDLELFAISVHGINQGLSMQGNEHGSTDTKS